MGLFVLAGVFSMEPPAIILPPNLQAIVNPFTVIIDTDEKKPYGFLGLKADADKKNRPLTIPTVRKKIKTGDYSILGMETCLIERKSKEDLYASIGRRKNFTDRLKRMEKVIEAGGYCCIVIESSDPDFLKRPDHSRINVKSLNRTILSWRQRYRTDWHFYDGRERAEAYTFRILEQFWRRHQPRKPRRVNDAQAETVIA